MYAWLSPTKSRLREKSGADGERVQADVPEAQIARLVDVAQLFQRRQKPVRGRWRQAHAVGKIGQRDPAIGLRERFENVETRVSGSGPGR
jgi:hypothetical protein